MTDLVADTMACASSLARDEAVQAMSAAEAVGRMLIAGGHLQEEPIVLVAGKLYCEMTTVSGTAALSLEESLAPIPGAADADNFTIHLPSPNPLEEQVKAAAGRHPRVSVAAPAVKEARAASSGPLIDREALRRLAGPR